MFGDGYPIKIYLHVSIFLSKSLKNNNKKCMVIVEEKKKGKNK